MEINHISNNGLGIHTLKNIISDRLPFYFEKNKKNIHVGLYTLSNPHTKAEYRWLSESEYELIKALNPDLHLKLSRSSMILAYEEYKFNLMPKNMYKREYINTHEQQIYIRLNRWNNVTYNYTTKFNLAGLIKQLQATANLMRNYKSLNSRPSLIQVLTQIYYNPDYIKKFMEHPREHLQILRDTDFYHYFKMLHPETVYSYNYTDTE